MGWMHSWQFHQLGGKRGEPSYCFQVSFSSRPVLNQTILSDFKKKCFEEACFLLTDFKMFV